MSDSKKMTAQAMSDEGYLQEVNRRFFHPLGLAMFVDPETEEMGVYDDRGDPEGWYFGGEYSRLEPKATKVDKEMISRTSSRIKALGFFLQPIRTDKKVDTSNG